MVMQLFERNAEAKLVEALNSVTDPAGWYAVHFHLSELMEQFKSEYQAKIAVNLINDLLKNFDGGIFVLQDMSIIVVCYGLEKALQNKLIFQLRYLYMDDPLAYSDSGQENPAFCTGYDLQQDWHAFMDVSTKRMALNLRRPGAGRAEKIAATIAETAIAQSAPPSAFAAQPSEPKTGVRLSHIDRELQHADIRKLIHRQTICAAQTGLPVRKVFDELYVHMSQLGETLKLESDYFSNRWLFRYMTQQLDLRMLEFLKSERDQFLTKPVSINIHVETLLSQKFMDFDQSVDRAHKAGIVLEIPLVDAFVDMAGFHIARKEMQALGYRICLDGVTADSLNHIQREKLGVDLVKVQWNANLLEPGQQREDMRKAVSTNGSSRVILCRCDNKQAIEYGQSIGIALFQGRYIDSVLNPSAPLIN